MSVYKPVKSRFWHYDFQWKGRRFHGSAGVETRAKAQAVERRERDAVAQGIDPSGGMSLDQAAGIWWNDIGQYRVSAHKIERRIAQLLRLMKPATKIRDIGTKEVSWAIETRRGETFARAPDKPGKKAKRYRLANATINADIIDTLRPIMNHAAKVKEEPGLKTIDWKRLRLQEPEELVQYYTRDQEAAWLAECDPTAREALNMLLTYGIRYGRLFFKPTDFDPNGEGLGPRVTIRNARTKGGVQYIRLTEAHARRIAARVGLAQAAGLDTVWFERGPKGRLVPLTYLGLQARLRSAARRAGLGEVPRVIHGARHHVGTTVLRETQNIRLTQKVLNHKDIRSTMRYAHVLEDEIRTVLEAKSRNSPGPQSDEGEFIVPQQASKGKRPSLS